MCSDVVSDPIDPCEGDSTRANPRQVHILAPERHRVVDRDVRVPVMKILPLSEAKAKLSALVDQVRATDEEVVITKNGRPAAALVSPDEYEGWKETIAIHGDAVLMRDIKAGLGALKARKAKVYTLEELRLGSVDICHARPSFRHGLPESRGHGGHPCDLDAGIPPYQVRGRLCRHDVDFCLAMRSNYKGQQTLVIRDERAGCSAGLYFPAFPSLGRAGRGRQPSCTPNPGRRRGCGRGCR